MPNKELDNLRKEAEKRRKAATAKIARLRKQGILVSETSIDPRLDTARVNRYTRSQVQAYINRLNNFVDRNTAFVPGAGGTPLPIKKWQDYKRLQDRFNSVGQSHFDEIASIFIPNAGLTIEQREQNLPAKRAHGAAANRPYSQVTRSSTDIVDAEALITLTRDLRKKLNRKYLPDQIAKARVQIGEMNNIIGSKKLSTDIDKLTDNQLDILWNYTAFASKISERYEIMKARAAGMKERQHEAQLEDNTSDIRELISWALTQPAQRSKRK